MVAKYAILHPEYKATKREQARIYYANNRDKILDQCKIHNSDNKQAISLHNKEYYEKRKQEIKEKRALYRQTHKKEIAEERRARYIKDKAEGKVKTRDKGKVSTWGKDRRIRIKLAVMSHYGNGQCKCVKCGFDDIRALSIDHVNGDGADHRRNNKYTRGNHMYEWLIKNNFPNGFQTLCMNCQLIKRQENKEFYINKTQYNKHETISFQV